MHRARSRATVAALAITALLASGCGESAGPAGGGVTGGLPASSTSQPGNSILDRLFGNDVAPSRVAADTTITDTVAANYGAVPGASSLDASELSSLEVDDDPFTGMQTADYAADDLDLDTVGIDDDPMQTVSDITWDSASTDAVDTYGSDGGLDDMYGGTDPMLEDPELEAELASLDM